MPTAFPPVRTQYVHRKLLHRRHAADERIQRNAVGIDEESFFASHDCHRHFSTFLARARIHDLVSAAQS